MTIEITDEMRAAFRAEHEDWCDEVGCGRDDCLNDRLAAVLAIVERARPVANGLMQGAAAARTIADRLDAIAKNYVGETHKHRVAMSAGARLVAVKLTEMADQDKRTTGSNASEPS